MIKDKIAARARARTRNSMRGYRMLKESGKLEFIINVKDEITNTCLNRINGKAAKLFFGAAVPDAEWVLRQFLVSRIVSYDFNKKVLAALGNGTSRISHPLPPEWRKVLEKHGLIADTFRNKFIWNFYVLAFFFFGCTIYLRMLLKNIKGLMVPSFPKKMGAYAYFHSLTTKNLPHQDASNTSYDVFTWYTKRKGKTGNIEALYHSIQGAETVSANGLPVMGIPAPVPSLASLAKVGSYFFWGTKAFLVGLIDFFRSRYWHALLFREAAVAAETRLQDPERLAREYWFHNANWIYRPLWTYEAEKKGAKVIFYFYSTNLELYKLPTGYTIPNYHWQLANWPNYVVWDEWQADFLRRMVRNSKNIDIAGSIWFSTSTKHTALPENSIVVFDINPLRDARYHIFVEPLEYLVPAVVNRFLQDIYTVVDEHALTMVLKRKRDIGSLLNARYKRVVDKLTASDHFMLVDMDLPAQQLISDCRMVISLPFTSTALIARELGKPTCFYDPSGLIQKDDRAAHGIRVVTGIDELREWVSSVLNTPLHPVTEGLTITQDH